MIHQKVPFLSRFLLQAAQSGCCCLPLIIHGHFAFERQLTLMLRSLLFRRQRLGKLHLKPGQIQNGRGRQQGLSSSTKDTVDDRDDVDPKERRFFFASRPVFLGS